MWLTDQVPLFRLTAFIFKAGQSLAGKFIVLKFFLLRRPAVPKSELVIFFWHITIRVLQRRLIFLLSLFKPLKSDIEV